MTEEHTLRDVENSRDSDRLQREHMMTSGSRSTCGHEKERGAGQGGYFAVCIKVQSQKNKRLQKKILNLIYMQTKCSGGEL